MGWAYWEFKKFRDLTTTAGQSSEGVYEDDGTLQINKIKALARTYAKAIQGTPAMTRFNSQNGAFSMTFTFDATITEPTLIFLSQDYFYQNGYTLLIFNDEGLILNASQYAFTPRANFINDFELQILDKTLHGQNLEVTILAK